MSKSPPRKGTAIATNSASVSILLALWVCSFLLQPGSLIAQNPSCPVPIVDCSGNSTPSATVRLLVGGVSQGDANVHVGDTLAFQVTVAVPADQSCAMTNVDAFLGFADGTVVQVLSHACIGANGSANITCPGNPSCMNTNLMRYTVRAEDIGKGYSLSEPNVFQNNWMNDCFAARQSGRIGVVLNVVGVSVGTTAVTASSSCGGINALVISPCLTCTSFCTNNIGDNRSEE